MPKLPVYDSPMADRGLQPSSLGVNAAEQEGEAWDRAFHQIGAAAQTVGNVIEHHNEVQDQAQLSQQMGDAFAGLTKDWNQTASAPDAANNPDLAQNWQSNVLDPALAKLGADVNSKEGAKQAEELRQRLRMHFLEKTESDQSTLSGYAVQSGMETMTNRLTGAVAQDPSTMDAAIDIGNSMVNAMIASHKMEPDKAALLRNHFQGLIGKNIAQSAFDSLAVSNPQAAEDALNAGKFDSYFNGAEIKAAHSYLQTQGRLNNTLLEKQNKDAAQADAANIQATTIDQNGNLTIPQDYFANVLKWANKYKNMPGTGETVANMQRTMIDYGRSIMRELAEGKPAVTDPHTYEDFQNRITLGQDDPNAVTDEQLIRARADGMLSDKDYGFLKGAVSTLQKDPAYKVAQTQFKTFMKGIKSSITNSNILMGSNDPGGDQKYLQFQQAATTEFENAYKTGKWRDLLDRNKANSLWHQAVPYMTNQKGAMQNLQDRVQGNVGLVPSINAPKRNAGESAADYLKRTGGP